MSEKRKLSKVRRSKPSIKPYDPISGRSKKAIDEHSLQLFRLYNDPQKTDEAVENLSRYIIELDQAKPGNSQTLPEPVAKALAMLDKTKAGKVRKAELLEKATGDPLVSVSASDETLDALESADIEVQGIGDGASLELADTVDIEPEIDIKREMQRRSSVGMAQDGAGALNDPVEWKDSADAYIQRMIEQSSRSATGVQSKKRGKGSRAETRGDARFERGDTPETKLREIIGFEQYKALRKMVRSWIKNNYGYEIDFKDLKLYDEGRPEVKEALENIKLPEVQSSGRSDRRKRLQADEFGERSFPDAGDFDINEGKLIEKRIEQVEGSRLDDEGNVIVPPSRTEPKPPDPPPPPGREFKDADEYIDTITDDEGNLLPKDDPDSYRRGDTYGSGVVRTFDPATERNPLTGLYDRDPADTELARPWDLDEADKKALRGLTSGDSASANQRQMAQMRRETQEAKRAVEDMMSSGKSEAKTDSPQVAFEDVSSRKPVLNVLTDSDLAEEKLMRRGELKERDPEFERQQFEERKQGLLDRLYDNQDEIETRKFLRSANPLPEEEPDIQMLKVGTGFGPPGPRGTGYYQMKKNPPPGMPPEKLKNFKPGKEITMEQELDRSTTPPRNDLWKALYQAKISMNRDAGTGVYNRETSSNLLEGLTGTEPTLKKGGPRILRYELSTQSVLPLDKLFPEWRVHLPEVAPDGTVTHSGRAPSGRNLAARIAKATLTEADGSIDPMEFEGFVREYAPILDAAILEQSRVAPSTDSAKAASKRLGVVQTNEINQGLGSQPIGYGFRDEIGQRINQNQFHDEATFQLAGDEQLQFDLPEPQTPQTRALRQAEEAEAEKFFEVEEGTVGDRSEDEMAELFFEGLDDSPEPEFDVDPSDPQQEADDFFSSRPSPLRDNRLVRNPMTRPLQGLLT